MTTYANVGRILLKRGNTSQQTLYTGPVGELTFDTDLNTVRVHNGATAGGVNVLATQAQITTVNNSLDLAIASTNSNLASAVNAINNNISTITGLDATFVANINTLLSNAATQQTTINTLVAGAYSNANVAAYLPTYGGAMLVSNIGNGFNETVSRIDFPNNTGPLSILNNAGDITIVSDQNTPQQWTFSADGSLTIPTGAPINYGNGNAKIIAGMGFHIQSEEGISLEAVNTGSSTTYGWGFGTDGKVSFPQSIGLDLNWTSDTAGGGPGDRHYDSLRINNDHLNGLYITNTMDGTATSWLFGKDGSLTLPASLSFVGNTDNTDPMYMAKNDISNNVSSLDVYIGDDGNGNDLAYPNDGITDFFAIKTVNTNTGAANTGIRHLFSGNGTYRPATGIIFPDNTTQTTAYTGQNANTGDIVFNGGELTTTNNGENIRIQVGGPDVPYGARSQLIWHADNESKYNTVFADPSGVSIRSAQWTGPEDNYANYWQFTTNGDLTTPADTNIITASGDLTLSANNVNITGNLDVQGGNGSFIMTFGPRPNNQANYIVESVAAGPDGAIYITGSNFNNNDTRWPNAPMGFLTKVDNNGKIVYETVTAYSANTQQRPISWGESIRYNTHGLAVVYNDYTENANITAALINPADGSITSQVYLRDATGNGLDATDIDVDSSGSSVVVGVKYNEYETYANIVATATAGGGTVIGVPASTFTANVNDFLTGNGSWVISGNNISGTATIVGVNQFLAVPSTAVSPSTGVGATFNVTYDSNGAVTATVASGGIGGYQSNDQVKILGTDLGGASPDNDIVLYVASDGTYVTGVNSVHTGTAQTATVYLTIDQTVNFNIGDLYTITHYTNADGFVSTAGWRVFFGGDGYDYPETVSVDAGGNIFVAGGFTDTVNNHYLPLVAKFDSAGTLLWSKTITIPGQTYGYVNGSAVDNAGNLVTIGIGNAEYPVITKIDTTGHIIWQQTMFSEPFAWGGQDIVIDSDNNIYIGGGCDNLFSYEYSGNGADMYIAKFDSNGTLLWQNLLGTQGYEWDYYDYGCRTMTLVGDHVVIGGYSGGVANTSHSHPNGFVAKIPADGTGQGTYGDWTYISTPFWEWEFTSANSTDFTIHVITAGLDVNTSNQWQHIPESVTTKTTRFGGTGVITGVTEIVKEDGSPLAGPDSNWTNPNNNTWHIRTYNGGYSFTYAQGASPTVWWDANNSPLGNLNQFRGAVIEYHAYISGNTNGTVVGSIIVAQDGGTNIEATHTENIDLFNNASTVNFWSRPNYTQLGYSNSGLTVGGQQDNVMIMWTARVFYGAENAC